MKYFKIEISIEELQIIISRIWGYAQDAYIVGNRREWAIYRNRLKELRDILDNVENKKSRYLKRRRRKIAAKMHLKLVGEK